MTRLARRLTLLVSLSLLAPGCASEKSAADAPPPAPKKPSMKTYMSEHYNEIVEITEALIASDLEKAKVPAAKVGSQELPENLPPGWPEYMTAVHGQAKNITNATDLAAAAMATAQMAGACGRCHLTNRGGPFVLWPPDPPEGADRKTHMQRHMWLTTRLFEGVIGPDNDAWGEGIRALKEEPLKGHVLTDDPEKQQAAEAMAGAVHELADKGEGLTGPEERAELLGTMLTRCVACHVTIRDTAAAATAAAPAASAE